jgi:hypothetical protein
MDRRNPGVNHGRCAIRVMFRTTGKSASQASGLDISKRTDYRRDSLSDDTADEPKNKLGYFLIFLRLQL